MWSFQRTSSQSNPKDNKPTDNKHIDNKHIAQKPSRNNETVLKNEQEHHDRWASEIDIRSVPVQATLEGSTSPENRFILSRLGNVSGKRILELGSGMAEASVYFAMKGACCTATDLSPGMVAASLELAKTHGVEIKARVMNSVQTDFPNESFDIVYAANFLHHVDPKAALLEMKRLLKPGGKACFWDPLKHNPVKNVYRRMASNVRSPDEAPLDINIIETTSNMFTAVQYDTDWLCTLWIFLRFYLIEGIHPNTERYWKKILNEEERLRPGYLRLEKVDRMLKQLPFMKRLAWNVAVVATK